MRYLPANASTGRSPSAWWPTTRLRLILSIVAALAIGLVPALVIAHPAQAAAGDVDFAADIEAGEGDTFSFDLRRTGGWTSSPLDLTYMTVDGTATAGADYTAVSGTVSFPASSTRDVVKRIVVQGLQDTLDEDNETFSVVVKNGPTTVTTGNGMLDDDDPTPTYTLTTATNPVGEGVGNVTVTATLSAVSGRAVTIPFHTQDNTAVAPEDYTAVPNGSITINAGQPSGTSTIAITDDTYDDADLEYFKVISGVGSNGEQRTNPDLSIGISDDDVRPTLSVSAPGATLEGTPLSFTVSLTSRSNQTVTVLATTSDGTATAGQDYTTINQQMVTFSPGATSHTVDVTTLSDTVNEVNPETLTLTLTSPVNAESGTMSAVGGISDDDDPPTATLTPTTVTEGDSGTTLKTFTVTLDGPSGRVLHVGYTVNSDTAIAGQDFAVNTGGTLTFNKGDLTKTFTVGINGDTTYEPNEQFKINLSDLDTALHAGGSLGDTAITIPNDDAKPSLQPVTDIIGAEGNTSNVATFHATISNPSSVDIVLDVTALDITAESNGSGPGSHDYDAPQATATIPAGQTSVDIPVTVNGDTVYEANETATIHVATQVGDTNVTSGTRDATLRLNNDDTSPTIVLTGGGDANEGDTIPMTATVTGVAQAAIPITVAVTGAAYSGHVAADNADFDGSGLTATSIPPGASSVPLGDLLIQNDQIDEDTQEVKVEVTSGVIATGTAYVAILDAANDLPPSVSVDDVTVNENDSNDHLVLHSSFGQPGNDATSTERTVTAVLGATDGTAHAGSDYTAFGTGGSAPTVTFHPNDYTNGVADGSFTLPLINDNAFERTETFTAGIVSATPSDVVISRGTATVTILDDDAGNKPSFSIRGPVTFHEGDQGTADFRIDLTAETLVPVVFDVHVDDGTAKDNLTILGTNDFDAPAATATVPAGADHVTVSVPVNNDTVYEPTETATFRVGRHNNDDGATGAEQTATLTITDDDPAPTVTVRPGSGPEGAPLAITATVVGVAQNAIPVTLTATGMTTNGSVAAAGSDFDATGLLTSIPAGDNTATLLSLGSVTLNADTIDEADETFRVTLNGGGVIATNAAFQTITDDPNDMGPKVYVDDLSTTEGVGTASVPVRLVFDSGATSTERTYVVNWSTMDGTAKAPGDYTARNNQPLTFSPGTTSLTADVPIVDDAIYEPAEMFSVKAVGVHPTDTTASDAVLTDDTGLITIAESDTGAKPTFSVADVSEPENVASGHANFQVRLSDTSTEDVTFDVSMSDGTAVDGGSFAGANDYDGPPAHVTIHAGETSAMISVPINNDQVYETDETATLHVALPAGQTGAVTGTDDSTLTILNDDAVPTISVNSVSAVEHSTVSVKVTPTGVAQANMIFDLTFSGDSSGTNDPAEPEDYVAGSTSGTIPGGTPSGTELTLSTINYSDDAIDENNEVIGVHVVDRAGLVTTQNSTYTITDDPNDKPPSISIGDLSVPENVGNAQVPVTLSFGGGNGATSTDRDTVVNYQTVDGSAKAGSDFTGTTTGSVTIPHSLLSGTISVPITDDTVYERDETFGVSLTSHVPSEAEVTRDTGTVTILLNDLGQRQTFTVTGVDRPENVAGPANVVVTLANPTTQDVSFRAAVAAGTATTGPGSTGHDDYTFNGASTTYTIAAGDRSVTIPVTINGDLIYEDDESAVMTVSLAPGEDDAVGGPTPGTIMIRNDEAPPVITYNNGESGTEGTDIAVIAKSDELSQADLTFGLALSGDSSNGNVAATADDYVDTGGTGVIPAGTAVNTPVTLRTFRLANDHIDEPVEAVRATVTAIGTPITTGTPIYKINDDPNDLPPSVSVTDFSVGEGDGTAQVPVALTFDPATNDATSTTRPTTITYATMNGTAVAPSDYTAVSTGSITIAAGTLTGAIPVQIIDDSRNELNETFSVKASAVSPPEAAIIRSTGTVTIVDNDQGASRPGFAISDVTKIEDSAGPAVFTVTLGSAAEDDVDFAISATDGTAVDAGSGVGSNDYDAPEATLRIPQGSLTGTIAVPVNPDTVYEGDETATVRVALADGERDAVGVPKVGTLTIRDDDAVPTIALNTASGTEGDDVSVIGTVTGVTQRDVTYNLVYSGDSTGSNSPASSLDYGTTGVTPVVPGGTATGARVNFGSIHLTADHIDEPVETIRVNQMTGPSTVGATTTYKINDDPNDLPPSISIGDVTVGEADVTAQVPVTLSWGAGNDATSTARDTVVSYTTANGTALAGSDYTAVTSSVTIGAGVDHASIPISITDDTRDEPDETFTVTTTAHTPGEAAVLNTVGTVTIIDNDAAAARPGFTVADVSKAENAGPATFVITLTGPPAQDDVTFTVGMTDGTAVDAGTGVGSNDFNPPATTYTIPVGDRSVTVPVTINNDAVYESDETATLNVALAPGERDAAGSPAAATLTITNDDAVPTIALNTASGTEGDDVSVIGTVTGVTQRDVTYNLVYSGDSTGSNSPASSLDYGTTGVTPVVPGGTATGARVNFGSIHLTADHIDEPVETIRVNQMTGPSTVGATTTYKINDDPNDLPPSISIGDVTVGEADVTAQVPVTLSWGAGNDATSTARDTVVSYTTANGTALAGSDYTAVTSSVTIGAGVDHASIPISITDDTRDEPDETFTVTTTAHTPGEAAVLNTVGTVTIIDNDAAAARPGFTVADVSKAENAGPATFVITLTGPPAQDDVTFTVGMTDGTAVDAGTGVGSNDFNPPATTYTIPVGDRSVTVPVTINNDAVYESDETATLNVALAPGERDAAGPPAAATLTITNDDAVPTVNLNGVTGNEGDDVTLLGTVVGSTQVDATIPITFTGDSSGSNKAAEPADWDDSNVTPVVPAGSTTGSPVDFGTLLLTTDEVDELVETIKGDAGGRTAFYRINDDPGNLPPTVSVSDESVGEGDGTISLDLTLNFPAGTTSAGYDITVPWSTVDGTARAGQDYTTRNSSAVIAAGNTSSTINVPIIDDQLSEPDQTFTVRLGTPSPSAVTVADGTGTATIDDNDAPADPTLTVVASRIGAGPVTLSGATNVESGLVQLWAAPMSTPTLYTMVQSMTAGTNGAYSFTRTLTDGGYNFKVVVNGRTSAIRGVQLQAAPAIAAVSGAKGTVTLTATGNPRTAGQTVALERLNANGTWTTVSTGKLTSAGTYSLVLRGLTSKAAYTYRATVLTNTTLGIIGGASSARRVIIA